VIVLGGLTDSHMYKKASASRKRTNPGLANSGVRNEIRITISHTFIDCEPQCDIQQSQLHHPIDGFSVTILQNLDENENGEANSARVSGVRSAGRPADRH
jgi:hypothetical protein